ncbi:MAG: DUF4838 domain-containing protein [Lentisphaerae bacterium]|nr:DUF4838 domain-containing protein [Lentisphaerota bacterium]MBT5612348.1 DUF4838 domain-containing protein [Lentisphaerota bacterium]MBT7056652.1 DUF4838 domain-containing protein [Lentisphaerota bacterium]MBT7840577.1 DUF4838 domain-containing protein [Lentisphaerota bacterium]
MNDRHAATPRTTAARCLPLILLAAIAGRVIAADAPSVILFTDERPLAYLDLTEADAGALSVAEPVADFLRCFRVMTGHDLPRSGGKPRLFDPTPPEPTRFGCLVTGLRDASAYGAPNAQVALVVSPVRHFPGHPFAAPGEKVGWTCTWDKRQGKLTFTLTVANQAYYGPGYGPFTFASVEAEAPDFTAQGSLRMALDIRHAEGGCLRGNYAINGGPWVSTQWFNPVKAGADDRQPGTSDKNGPQMWDESWAQTWRGQATLHVTAYHPKGRKASVTVNQVRVTRGAAGLFASGFARAEAAQGNFAEWAVSPGQGQATPADSGAVLNPASGGWNTVGLRAQEESRIDPARTIPIRITLLDVPAQTSRFDPRTTQSFEVDVRENAVELRAFTALGLQNAFYHVLHQWGCRWVIPGPLGECIPKHTQLALPQGTVRITPRADTAMDRSAFPRWGNRNLGGWQHWLSGQHYWFYALPPKRHFAEHPEWYSLIGDKREPRQLCTSNPEVIAQMIRAAKAFLKRSPTAASFPMDPNDGIDFCQCADCTALDMPGATTNGAPSVTSRVLTFANAVANGIREEFPDRCVAFYAYWTHIDPPTRVTPEDNVVIIVCRSSHCLQHLTPDDTCPTSDFHALVQRWRNLTPNTYAYEYDPISWTGGLPCPTYLQMGRSLQHLFDEVGIKGSYSDGAQYAAHASTYINRYIARRMKLDPRQSPEAVLHDMCQHFFGPAAHSMEQYYLELAKTADTPHAGRTRVGGGSTFYHEMFPQGVVQAARRFLDQGLSLTGDQAPYAKRVAMVDLSQRYLEAYLGGVWAAQAGNYEAAMAGFDRMDGLIDTMEAPGFLDAVDARRRATTMRLKTLAEHFPQKLGFVTRWKLLGPFDNSDRNADVNRDRFEPIRSLDQSLRTADGAPLEWWDYESAGGLLNLERAFAHKPRAWTLSYAYAAVVYETPTPLVAQLRMDSFFPFRVSVNGNEAFHRQGLNADRPDRQLVDVKLVAGTNTIVVKLSQTQLTTNTFPWGLYLRIVAEGEDAAVLPETWSFRKDPQDVGTQQKWQNEGIDGDGWQPIRVPGAWEKTIGPYDGTGWYRVHFELPVEHRGAALRLAFRGVDEQAWVYLNGELVGERTTASTGKGIGEIWDQPFEIPLPPPQIRWGGKNLLVVKVHDSKFAGGLFRNVRLLLGE